MYRVEYKGNIYSGQTEKELMLNLRQNERLSLVIIGNIMGFSRQRARQIMGPVGKLKFPELRQVGTFDDTDESIAMRLNVPISKVAAARRKLGLKSTPKIDIDMRRKNLAQYLFKKDPGIEFVFYIDKCLDQLHAGRARVLREFYILGSSVSSADNLNIDTARTYRAIARQKLREIVSQYDIDRLIKEGVLDG